MGERTRRISRRRERGNDRKEWQGKEIMALMVACSHCGGPAIQPEVDKRDKKAGMPICIWCYVKYLEKKIESFKKKRR